MKVLVKNFDSGFKKLASLDENYLLRQSKIIEMYKMLIGLFRLTTARKQIMVGEKSRMKKIEEIQSRNRARAIHMRHITAVANDPGRLMINMAMDEDESINQQTIGDQPNIELNN